MLATILKSLVRLHDTKFWPEIAAVLVTLLRDYEERVQPRVVLVRPKEREGRDAGSG